MAFFTVTAAVVEAESMLTSRTEKVNRQLAVVDSDSTSAEHFDIVTVAEPKPVVEEE